MKLKPGVSLKGVQWQMFHAAIVIEECFAKRGLECVITSATDGKHGKGKPRKGKADGTLHDDGLALDFRKRTVPIAIRPKLLKDMRQALGPEYDVIEESDHYHVEHDPR